MQKENQVAFLILPKILVSSNGKRVIAIEKVQSSSHGIIQKINEKEQNWHLVFVHYQ